MNTAMTFCDPRKENYVTFFYSCCSFLIIFISSQKKSLLFMHSNELKYLPIRPPKNSPKFFVIINLTRILMSRKYISLLLLTQYLLSSYFYCIYRYIAQGQNVLLSAFFLFFHDKTVNLFNMILFKHTCNVITFIL